jgi:hypothetical protein
VPIARLVKPPKAESTCVNEYFGGKRNEVSGTLWTDTIYFLISQDKMFKIGIGLANSKKITIIAIQPKQL